MSKAKVEEAIRLAAAGQESGAKALLEAVDRGFLEKRLRHHLERIALHRDGAVALWKHYFGSAAGAPPEVASAESEPEEAVATTPTATPFSSVELPTRMLIEAPAAFLRAVSVEPPVSFDLDGVEIAQIFSLVGIAALARCGADGSSRYEARKRGHSAGARFAHAVGFDEIVDGRPQHSPGEEGRTVNLRRLVRFEQIEVAASEISRLILPRDEEGRRTIYYVLVELLRNVVQHSQDRFGAVVAAQRMDQQQQYQQPAIQVAVGDAGIGILAAMRGLHVELQHPGEALEKALRPHISGTFEEGLTGSQQNAGMRF